MTVIAFTLESMSPRVNASGPVVAEMVSDLREALRRFWPAPLAADASVLYGGSVTPDNAVELVSSGKVDGFLVGGASLDSAKFVALHAALATPAG